MAKLKSIHHHQHVQQHIITEQTHHHVTPSNYPSQHSADIPHITSQHPSSYNDNSDHSIVYHHPNLFNNYLPSSLSWNDLHTLNTESIYCYCGQDRFLDIYMLQCKHCLNWYHEECIRIRLCAHVLFMANYEFTCAACSTSGVESFTRTQPAWKEVVATVLANLMMLEIKKTHLDLSAHALTHASIEPSYFIREDFAQFIESHWSALWGNKEKVNKVWKGTLSTTLYQYRDVFITTVDTRITQAPFTLFDQNLFNIRPGYLDMFSKTPGHSRLSARIIPTLKNATDQVTSGTAGSASSLHSLQQLESVIPGTTSMTVFIGGTSYSLLKNRGVRKERGMALPSASVPPGLEVPFNRDGFKYTLAEINPCLRYTAYRECHSVPGRIAAASMSKEDRSPSITLNPIGTSISSAFGFRTARAIFPMRQGAFYFEVFVEKGCGTKGNIGENPFVRVGVAKREASLLGPVGSDSVGFAYRDKSGERVTNCRPSAYGESFTAGDTIGVLLILPKWMLVDHTSQSPNQTHLAVMRDRTPIRFKSSVYLETKDYLPLRDHPLPHVSSDAFKHRIPTVPNSKLVFFKNGQCQGIAFDELPAPVRHVCSRINEQMAAYDDGSLGYYPAISCYRGGQVAVNFGPHFLYPLPESYDPMSDTLPSHIERTCFLNKHAPFPLDNTDECKPEPYYVHKSDSNLVGDVIDIDPTSLPSRNVADPAEPGLEPVRCTRAHAWDLSSGAETTNHVDTQEQIIKPATDRPLLQVQYHVSQAEFLRVGRKWHAYAETQWDHDTEECLWDMLDEIDHWHALDVCGIHRSDLPHPAPIMLDREGEQSLRPIPNLTFPTRNETYAEHIVSAAKQQNRDTANLSAQGACYAPLTLRQLLMPNQPSAVPVKRARVKWALTEEP